MEDANRTLIAKCGAKQHLPKMRVTGAREAVLCRGIITGKVGQRSP